MNFHEIERDLRQLKNGRKMTQSAEFQLWKFDFDR